MGGKINLMTKNMLSLYKGIVSSLAIIPTDQKEYLFGPTGEEEYPLISLISTVIAFEFIKYSYDREDKTYPLRHFLKEGTDDERMLQSRILKYVLKHKKEEIAQLGIKLPEDHKFSRLDMSTIEKRLRGYRITEMNFFEHQVIHDLELVKSITEKRINSAKKVSNARFKEMFEQYDAFVESLLMRSKKNDEEMLFASISFFTFEWHYPIEMFYRLSIFMEERGITAVDRNILVLLCAPISVESRFGGWFTGNSRMVKERATHFIGLFDPEMPDSVINEVCELLKELFVLNIKYNEAVTINGGDQYKEWFRKESSVKDRASFLRYYDLFSIWKKKQWTNKTIKNMRYLLGALFQMDN